MACRHRWWVGLACASSRLRGSPRACKAALKDFDDALPYHYLTDYAKNCIKRSV